MAKARKVVVAKRKRVEVASAGVKVRVKVGSGVARRKPKRRKRRRSQRQQLHLQRRPDDAPGWPDTLDGTRSQPQPQGVNSPVLTTTHLVAL